MKAVIKYKMFAPNQKLCIIEDGHISNTIIINSFDIAEVANKIVTSAKEMDIDEIDIAGVPNYTKKLGETIQKSQLLNYNCDTLKINYI